MIEKPRTFKSFPEDIKCPVCGTNEDMECILIEIDGTSNGKICEAKPVHLWCAIAKRFSKEHQVLYTKLQKGGGK